MSEKSRKSFTSQHKAKVALEAIRGTKTLNEIAQEFAAHRFYILQEALWLHYLAYFLALDIMQRKQFKPSCNNWLPSATRRVSFGMIAALDWDLSLIHI